MLRIYHSLAVVYDPWQIYWLGAKASQKGAFVIIVRHLYNAGYGLKVWLVRLKKY